MLSGLITEVARGLDASPRILENREKDLELKKERYEADRQERIKKLNESTKIHSPAFEDTSPRVESSSQSPLSGHSPNDPGIDISGILNVANGKWKKLI